ncbi:unnamed protein product [Calypogeia fissa]
MVKEEIDKLTKAGFIFPVLSNEWISPIVILSKKPGPDGKVKIRVCQDYRKLNAATCKDHYPLPFIDIVLDTVAGHSLFSFLDGYSSYNQISRVMMIIFQEYLHRFLEIFIDDFCVFTRVNDHLEKLELTFQKCREAQLCLHPEKCYMGMQKGLLLGHVISQQGIKVDVGKVDIIRALQPPSNLRELRAFLGHVGYYRRFIRHYAELAMPLTKLLKKEAEYLWKQDQQEAFEVLKLKLVTAPVLTPPDWDKLFHVYIDASAFCVGTVLSQKDGDGMDHPIFYASWQMNPAERNYTVTEREALSEYNFIVKVRSGKHHGNVDFLSRIPSLENEVPFNDRFPDEDLFYVDLEDSLYGDIIRLLTQGLLPEGLNREQQAVFLYKVGPYTPGSSHSGRC